MANKNPISENNGLVLTIKESSLNFLINCCNNSGWVSAKWYSMADFLILHRNSGESELIISYSVPSQSSLRKLHSRILFSLKISGSDFDFTITK